MVQLSEVAADLGKESDGVWVPYAKGIEFKIARLRNPAYRKALRRVVKERRGAPIEDADESIELLAPLIARHILKDWKNVTDSDGEAIPYDPDRGAKSLLEPENLDMYDFIVQAANTAAWFEQEQLEEAEKN